MDMWLSTSSVSPKGSAQRRDTVQRNFFLLLVILATFAGWSLYDKFEIEGLDKIRFRSKVGNTRSTDRRPTTAEIPTAVRTGKSIRIATFNIQVFGSKKTDKAHVMERLANIARRFDVLAVQEVRSKSPDIIPRFVESINTTGRRYDYVIGPPLGRSGSKEQYAYIFDLETIEVARNELYTVYDPDDILHREPLVGWFRVRGPPKSDAFTFSLVNVHTDSDETREELNALDDVYRAVLGDGRGEDDVIVLGVLNVNYKHLGELGQISGMTSVVQGQATNTRKTKSYDNILFHGQSTNEFLGRFGIFDMMYEFNLTEAEAIEISDHMPVWAEFSVYEGGQLGRVATRPTADHSN